jgi:molecular chaperone DnaK
MYAQAQAKAKAEESAGAAETSGADTGDAKEKENVVDAEFEEVKENKGKK